MKECEEPEYTLLRDDGIGPPTDTKEAKKARCLSIAKSTSVLLGFTVGAFIQCATFGMSMAVWMKAQPTEYNVVIYVWGIVSSLMGANVLLLLRALLESSFLATASQQEGTERWEEEDFIYKFLDVVDTYFSIGTITGLAVLWYIGARCLELENPFRESLVTVGLCLVWYALAINYMNRKLRSQKIGEAKKSDNEENLKVVLAAGVLAV